MKSLKKSDFSIDFDHFQSFQYFNQHFNRILIEKRSKIEQILTLLIENRLILIKNLHRQFNRLSLLTTIAQGGSQPYAP